MPNYHFQTIFEEKRSADPSAYAARENDLVGEYSPEVDVEIEECEKILDEDYLNPESEQKIRETFIRGIPLISVKYNPDKTRYQFIEKIMLKLANCSERWGTQYDFSDDRIKEIYDTMVSSAPIDQLLGKFTTGELTIYGW